MKEVVSSRKSKWEKKSTCVREGRRGRSEEEKLTARAELTPLHRPRPHHHHHHRTGFLTPGNEIRWCSMTSSSQNTRLPIHHHRICPHCPVRTTTSSATRLAKSWYLKLCNLLVKNDRMMNESDDDDETHY